MLCCEYRVVCIAENYHRSVYGKIKKEKLKTGLANWCTRFRSTFIFSSHTRRKSISNWWHSSVFDKKWSYCDFHTLLRLDEESGDIERAAVHGQSSVEEFALNLTRISATNLSFFTNIRGITLLSACPVVLQEMLKASAMKRLSKGIDYFLFSPFPPSLFHSWQRRFHLSEPAARASFTCAPLGWACFMNTAAELKCAWDL